MNEERKHNMGNSQFGTVITIIAGLALAYVLVGHSGFHYSAALPAYAGTLQTIESDTAAAPPAWLRVEVETNWGWFWQKSTARVYVVTDKSGKARTKAGKLCMKLQAHDLTQECVENADSLVIFEKKRGIGIPKKLATATAWAEHPNLEETSVSLAP